MKPVVEVRWSKGAYEWYYLCRACPMFDFGHTEWSTAMEAAYTHIAKSHEGSRLGDRVTGGGTRYEFHI